MKNNITLRGLQIKNIDKARKLAAAINTIEEECGVYHVEISLKDIFICEWIDLEELNGTEMECLIRDLLIKIRKSCTKE